MRAYVIGNVTIDETIIITELPVAGASTLGQIGSRDLGGKGTNQAVVMARCGVPTTLVAAVGNDARSVLIRQHLTGEPLISELVEIDGKSSDVSIIFRLPDGENAIVTITDAAQSLESIHVAPVLRLAEPGDLAIFQGNLSYQTTRNLLHQAKTLGMITAFNPSPLRPFFSDLWNLVDIAFLNRGEAQALTGATGKAAADCLIAKGLRTVVLTLGSEGAILVNKQEAIIVPARQSNVLDTTGAGDTFMSVALASCVQRSCPLDRRAVEHAAQAAALTVARHGTLTAFPSPSELKKILASQ